MSFWDNLKKPIFVLAPLADVTDAAFRRVIAKYSKPDGPSVMFTEFVSADGLVRAKEEGKRKLLKDLIYSESERPIVAQFFTSKPEMMEEASKLAVDLGFDGVDINMGCPDRSVERQGAGAALIKNPALAREIIQAANRGAQSGGKKLPVSVKTRIGYNTNQIEQWVPELLKEDLAALTIHARTRKEMSKVPAQWEMVKRAVEIRNELKSNTLILGNGDALNILDAEKKAEESGADGVMLGRAIFGTPWLFSNSQELQNRDDYEVRKKILNILLEHVLLFGELLGDIKNFAIMKKHFKSYVSGFPDAAELRDKLMAAETPSDVVKIVEGY
jgi:nifR3 family TIM-barrel protein